MNKTITHYLTKVQDLLPGFFDHSDIVTSKHFEIMCVLDEIELEKFFLDDRVYLGKGRPTIERLPFARAFIAKSVLNISQNKALIERLQVDPTLRRICGWSPFNKLPCEATFSNVFKEFSKNTLLQRAHNILVSIAANENPPIYTCRDSSEIDAREKPKNFPFTEFEVGENTKELFVQKKKEKASKKTYPRGRPKKDEKRPPKEETRLEKQSKQTLEEMLEDLPYHCNKGVKKNAQGYKIAWNGYKLHADVTEAGIPTALILTSASIHDSQVSLPLEEMTSKYVTTKYTLADAAYDSVIIKENIEKHEKKAIIDDNPRRKEKKVKTDEEKDHYKVRSTVERFFGDLKDNYSCRTIWVKGVDKIRTHVMFGVLALTALRIVSSRISS